MKLRYVLPVVVLALAVAFAQGTAQAQEANIGASVALANAAAASSTSDNNNENVNKNKNEVIVDVSISLGELDLPSSEFNMWESENKNFSDNRARIQDEAYNGAVGVNQAVVVAGQDNEVRQSSFAVYVEATEIYIGNTNSLL